jgi:hypothetical protein
MAYRSDLTRAVATLAAEVKLAHRIGRGDAYGAVEEAMERVARGLALQSWRDKKSPAGKAWAPGTSKTWGAHGGKRGDLYESGNLIRSVRIEERVNGFAISIRAAAEGGQFYGGTHQYGRTIRAKGFDPKRYAVAFKGVRLPMGAKARAGAVRSGFGIRPMAGSPTLKMRALRNAQGKYEYTTAPGAKALIGGRMKLRIPSRAMLPKGGTLPKHWEEAFIREATKWIRRYGGNHYTAGSPDIRG